MKQVPVKLGPLALLLTVISICLTTLAVMTFVTARADQRLAEKYADTVNTRYALETRGQEFLSEVSGGAGNEGVVLLEEPDQDGVSWNTFEQDGSRLKIGLKQGSGGTEVVAWKHERLWEEDTSMNLWPGLE